MSLTKDVEVLRNIPLFATVDPAKLKLLAFTSERLEYMSGDELFHQRDYGDAAYIILEGEADVLVDTPTVRSRWPRSARTTSSARSQYCVTCRALPQWSRMATSRSCACRRMGSSSWLPSFRRSASR